MAIQHAFGYSRSVRAKCHGPSPCNGTPLSTGTLRYGQATSNQYGENVEWRHWGCVTLNILQMLAIVNLNQVTGFTELSANDQAKIRLAIQLRRIDPKDVPETAKPKHTQSISQVQASQNNKRKAAEEISKASTSHVSFAEIPSAPPLAVEATDDEPPEKEVAEELYCTMQTNVVGVQYYEGLVGPGEEVILVREPQNRYDKNAVQVKNIGQVQVGHVPRVLVAKLAPLLDEKAVTIEGVINDGNLDRSREYTLSLTLRIYGAADKRHILEPRLIWATPGQRGFPPRPTGTSRGGHRATPSGSSSHKATASGAARTPSISAAQQEAMRKNQEEILKQQEALRKAAELKDMIEGLGKVDDQSRRSSLLDNVCSVEDILSLPLHPDPPGIKKGNLKVDLLKHQLQALQWCIEREHPVLPQKETNKPVQFWQYKIIQGQPCYFNLATKTPQKGPPTLGRGALCADAMGLGKTLTMIALVLATRGDESPGTSKTTLIVAPLSILSNWEKQIEDHCVTGTLSTCTYYGNNRNMTAQDLQKYDIVITTYQNVTGEHGNLNSESGGKKKRKIEQALFDVNWKRVILDEGHIIRNSKTKTARSVYALKAERRWVLSGTPIINSPKDLGSLLTFLRICRPLDNEDFFKRLLLRPLKDASPSGVELLKALMSEICIRRTKEMQDSQGNPLIPLPPVEMIRVPVTLNNEARRIYDQVEQLSRQRFKDYMNRRTEVQSNVLSMLTRMRQLVLHPALIPPNYLEELRKDDNGDEPFPVAPLTQEKKLRLQAVLAQAIEDCEECPICFDILNDPRITYCTHRFCFACITEALSRDPICPMDRQPISTEDLLEAPPPTELTQKPVRDNSPEETNGICSGSSAKIDQLIHLLQLTPSTEKSLVFSQFTSFLDKIEEALNEAGIAYVRFDGQMSAKRRQEAIARFSIPVGERISSRSNSQPSRATRSGRKGKSKEIIKDGDFDDDNDGDADFILPGDQAGDENPRIMLISLKAGALGLNLTVANNVYLMDPWWQEGIESQAIDRVNRIGQKKPVHVYQLIAEDTVESKVLAIQDKKKKFVQQAFHGIARGETQRQAREARLQDLIELFGARRQGTNDGDDQDSTD